MKEETRREYILAGKLIVTGKSYELPATIEPSSAPSTLIAPFAPTCQKPVSHSDRSRLDASIVWDHFNGGPGNSEKWYLDNSTTSTSKRSICSL